MCMSMRICGMRVLSTHLPPTFSIPTFFFHCLLFRTAAALPVRLSSSAASVTDAAAARGPPFVVVLSASNLPWELDDAFRRRLEKRIYIPLPNESDRATLLRIQLQGVELAPDVDVEEVARCTQGYSGADVVTLCRTAAMMPMRRMLEAARRAAASGAQVEVGAVARISSSSASNGLSRTSASGVSGGGGGSGSGADYSSTHLPSTSTSARLPSAGTSVEAVRRVLEGMGLIAVNNIGNNSANSGAVPLRPLQSSIGTTSDGRSHHPGALTAQSSSSNSSSSFSGNGGGITFNLAVERSHFVAALAATKPSVGASDHKRYEAWMAEYGSC